VLKEKGQKFNDVTFVHGFTALHLAPGYGRLKAVEYLLANDARKDIRLKAGNSAGETGREQSKHSKVAALVQDYWLFARIFN
jgi:ankyrin repeat protein